MTDPFDVYRERMLAETEARLKRPGESDLEYLHRLMVSATREVPMKIAEPKIYVVGPEAPHRGAVKIGYSGKLEQRLATLRSHSPIPLVLLTTFSGDYTLEGHLHAHFADRRTHGEWFDFGDQDPVPLIAEAVRLAG
ncbi:GIY-YIG nuclease family protein [Streptomyces sp. NPDC059431]|uniref:GIY-YIG nuclease family protein n=1 Tax=Streptomyces sp. NPDC059431 TaxID=3346828 RepID=UPI00369F2353